MRLVTSAERRSDGTVVLDGADGAQYVFERDADGELVCDVRDAATVAMALQTGRFYPADEDGEREAGALNEAPQPKKRGRKPNVAGGVLDEAPRD